MGLFSWLGIGSGSDSNGDSGSSKDIKIEGVDINPELQPGALLDDMDNIKGTTTFLGHDGSSSKGSSKK